MSKPFKFRPKRDLDENGQTNEVRANRALKALRVYQEEAGYTHPKAFEDPYVMQDFMTDLMHLRDKMSKTYGVSFEELLESARSHYMEER